MGDVIQFKPRPKPEPPSQLAQFEKALTEAETDEDFRAAVRAYVNSDEDPAG